MILKVLRSQRHVYCRLPLYRNLFDTILLVIGVMGFGERDCRGKVSFSSHHYQGHILSMCFIIVDVDFDDLAEMVIPRLIHCILSPLSMMYFLEKVNILISHIKRRELCSSCLRAEYLHIILNSTVWEICLISPFIDIFNHLFILAWSYEYLFYTLGHNQYYYFFVVEIVPDMARELFQ